MARPMPMGVAVVLSALLAALLSSRSPVLDSADTIELRGALEQRRAQLEAARAAGDLVALLNGYTEDARLFPVRFDPAIGRRAIAQHYRSRAHSGSEAEVLSQAFGTFSLQGEVAIEQGAVIGGEASYLAVWRYSAGDWKIMLDLRNEGRQHR